MTKDRQFSRIDWGWGSFRQSVGVVSQGGQDLLALEMEHRMKSIQHERDFHASKAAEHTSKVAELDAKLAAMEEAAVGNIVDDDVDQRRRWWKGFWGGAQVNDNSN
mmetsp:Transcript_351/g.439  ORF Transcript_351/g.439 Transcript_351/m.439 type:complete len:106 (+) Transcript_351:211-528(+)